MKLGLQIVLSSLWIVLFIGGFIAMVGYLWSSLHDKYGIDWRDIVLGIFGLTVTLLGICSTIVWVVLLIGGK